jgi:taurine dioxygenase
MMRRTALSRVLGIALEGVDLAAIDEAAFRSIEQAWWDGLVLAVRNQNLTPEAFLAFARRFGKPEPHVIDQFHYPGHPDILVLSNRRNEQGEPIGLADAGSYFHTDYSYLEVPAKVTILYSREVPKKGGDTLFANMYAAYDDLPASTKRRIANLMVRHHYGNRDDLDEASRTAASPLNAEQKERVDWVLHPLVRVHPGTRRKALYAVSGSSFSIVGMPAAKGRALLDELKAHALQEKYQYRYKWQVGDVVLWDDLALLHAATLTEPDDPRTLWRITVKEPRGAWA